MPGKERRELTIGITNVDIIGGTLRLLGGRIDWDGPK